MVLFTNEQWRTWVIHRACIVLQLDMGMVLGIRRLLLSACACISQQHTSHHETELVTAEERCIS